LDCQSFSKVDSVLPADPAAPSHAPRSRLSTSDARREFLRLQRVRRSLSLANIGGVDAGQMLSAVNAQTCDGWWLERRLAGGLNEGAHLLTRADGSAAVLKWRASNPERLLRARELVAAARAHGWPAPAWLACGSGPSGEAWVLQEFVDGRTPARLDDAVAEQMIEILGVQASLCPAASGGWGEWAWGVVFDDWEGMRDRARSGVPGGQRIVSAVDAIAAACEPGPLSNQDLVHGNFNLANTIAADGRLWLVDVEGLGPGPLAYDLAEALLVAAEHGNATESAAARLWAYASDLDRREFAICAGSVALTLVDASARHGRARETAEALPPIVRVLERALDLARA
jgi:aminoglycoside phosphotransferase (APT) family kinase protein